MKHEQWSKNGAWFLGSSSGGYLEDKWSLYSYQNLLKTKVHKPPKRMMKIREERANTTFRKTRYLYRGLGAPEMTRRPDVTRRPVKLRHWREQRCLTSRAKTVRSRSGWWETEHRSHSSRKWLLSCMRGKQTFCKHPRWAGTRQPNSSGRVTSHRLPPLNSALLGGWCSPSWDAAFRNAARESLWVKGSFRSSSYYKSLFLLVLEIRFCKECKDRPTVMALVSTILKILFIGLLCSFHCHCWEIHC